MWRAINPADVLATRRDTILSLAAKWGIRDVRVFGSLARREATGSSDLDLLVDVAPGRSLLDLVGFELDLEEALGMAVDVVTEPALHPLTREKVLADAVPV